MEEGDYFEMEAHCCRHDFQVESVELGEEAWVEGLALDLYSSYLIQRTNQAY